MENSDLNLEKLAILLKRRQNILREIISLTDEISEELNRQDIISANLLLDMRQDKLNLLGENREEMDLLGEVSEEAGRVYRELMGPKNETREVFHPDQKVPGSGSEPFASDSFFITADEETRRSDYIPMILEERQAISRMIEDLKKKQDHLDLRTRKGW
jgi:hypothetical protein